MEIAKMKVSNWKGEVVNTLNLVYCNSKSFAVNSFSQEIEIGHPYKQEGNYALHYQKVIGVFDKLIRSQGWDGSGPYEISLVPFKYSQIYKIIPWFCKALKIINPYTYYHGSSEQAGNHLHVSPLIISNNINILEEYAKLFNNLTELLPIFAPWFCININKQFYRFRRSVEDWAAQPQRVGPQTIALFSNGRNYDAVTLNANRKSTITLEIRLNEAPAIKAIVPVIAITILSSRYDFSIKFKRETRNRLWQYFIYDTANGEMFKEFDQRFMTISEIRNPFGIDFMSRTAPEIWKQIFTIAMVEAEKHEKLRRFIRILEFGVYISEKVIKHQSLEPLKTAKYVRHAEKWFECSKLLKKALKK